MSCYNCTPGAGFGRWVHLRVRDSKPGLKHIRRQPGNDSKTRGSLVQTTNRFLNDTAYRWYILVLAALTATLAVAMPTMALPVLFAEISADIGLSLVQIGIIWGSISLAGLLTGIAGRSLGDRFGTRWRCPQTLLRAVHLPATAEPDAIGATRLLSASAETKTHFLSQIHIFTPASIETLIALD